MLFWHTPIYKASASELQIFLEELFSQLLHGQLLSEVLNLPTTQWCVTYCEKVKVFQNRWKLSNCFYKASH